MIFNGFFVNRRGLSSSRTASVKVIGMDFLILILILISSQAIGNLIAKSEFDVYLLSELWMRPDHATIEALLPVVVFLIDMITVHYIHCNVHQLSFHAKLKMRIRATG